MLAVTVFKLHAKEGNVPRRKWLTDTAIPSMRWIHCYWVASRRWFVVSTMKVLTEFVLRIRDLY